MTFSINNTNLYSTQWAWCTLGERTYFRTTGPSMDFKNFWTPQITTISSCVSRWSCPGAPGTETLMGSSKELQVSAGLEWSSGWAEPSLHPPGLSRSKCWGTGCLLGQVQLNRVGFLEEWTSPESSCELWVQPTHSVYHVGAWIDLIWKRGSKKGSKLSLAPSEKFVEGWSMLAMFPSSPWWDCARWDGKRLGSCWTIAYPGKSKQVQKCIAEFSNRNGRTTNTNENLHISRSHG